VENDDEISNSKDAGSEKNQPMKKPSPEIYVSYLPIAKFYQLIIAESP